MLGHDTFYFASKPYKYRISDHSSWVGGKRWEGRGGKREGAGKMTLPWLGLNVSPSCKVKHYLALLCPENFKNNGLRLHWSYFKGIINMWHESCKDDHKAGSVTYPLGEFSCSCTHSNHLIELQVSSACIKDILYTALITVCLVFTSCCCPTHIGGHKICCWLHCQRT